MTDNSRSKARYARAAFVLSPITLDEATDAARLSILATTGERTADMIRRLIADEAERITNKCD